ncbi:hypothetical protein DID88_004623 [Monilinia fructigena]|uniref:Uncharacterized protein n=1 Tax=Monilinia fructigena TaxID=38457 RepID=A0A395IRL7_9HELO|nr:hypothetical protein DID88_004623 [Monilinia fructigena]
MSTGIAPTAVATESTVPTSVVVPQGMRKNGKQWHPANDEAIAATKAKEKEMKEEKEAARQAHITKNQGKSAPTRRKENDTRKWPNNASKACRQAKEKREEEQDVEVMMNDLLGWSMAYGLMDGIHRVAQFTYNFEGYSAIDDIIDDYEKPSIKSENEVAWSTSGEASRSEGVSSSESRNGSLRPSIFGSTVDGFDLFKNNERRPLKEGELEAEKEKGALMAKGVTKYPDGCERYSGQYNKAPGCNILFGFRKTRCRTKASQGLGTSRTGVARQNTEATEDDVDFDVDMRNAFSSNYHLGIYSLEDRWAWSYNGIEWHQFDGSRRVGKGKNETRNVYQPTFDVLEGSTSASEVNKEAGKPAEDPRLKIFDEL